MKNLIFLGTIVLSSIFFLTGCDTNRNFMDVDNQNAKEDLRNAIGNGKGPNYNRNLPNYNTNITIPDNLSGTIQTAKEYANRYYDDTLHGYVDTAKEGLSGTTQKLKGYYNSGVDQLNGKITDSVNGAISGELNKLKLK